MSSYVFCTCLPLGSQAHYYYAFEPSSNYPQVEGGFLDTKFDWHFVLK